MSDPASNLSNDPAAIWNAITEKLQEELPRQSYLTWFIPIVPVSYDDYILTLKMPNQFHTDWIVSHYSSHLQRAIDTTIGNGMQISYIIDKNLRHRSNADKHLASRRPLLRSPVSEPFNTNLSPDFSFDNFIEGDCNRFARAAALSIANFPGRTAYNPLMIYGGPGRGKTHLIQAIGNLIVGCGAAERVLYVTGEQFTRDFIDAIKSHHSEEFTRLYRHVDVLLLDDVQFFMEKGKTQEEFFHTFNALHLAGKQLVFSSDRSPRDLEGFDERLVSRLQWGLVTELTAPEYETRMAIIMNQAHIEDVTLPEDVAHFIATHITENIRSLRGALVNMLAKRSLLGIDLSMDLAREAVKSIIKRLPSSVSMERIQEVTAEEFGIPDDLLRSKTRKKEVTHARHIAMYLATEMTSLTLKAIGLHFGGRDHATVIHARETVCECMKLGRAEADIVNKIRQKLELESF
jgi:chromosomal replication initiator protein